MSDPEIKDANTANEQNPYENNQQKNEDYKSIEQNKDFIYTGPGEMLNLKDNWGKIQFSRKVYILLGIQSVVSWILSFISIMTVPAYGDWAYFPTNSVNSAAIALWPLIVVGFLIYCGGAIAFYINENLFKGNNLLQYVFYVFNIVGLSLMIMFIAFAYIHQYWIACSGCITLTYVTLFILTFVYKDDIKFTIPLIIVEVATLLIFIIVGSVVIPTRYIPVVVSGKIATYRGGMYISSLFVAWILTSIANFYIVIASYYMLTVFESIQNSGESFYSTTVFYYYLIHLFKHYQRTQEKKDEHNDANNQSNDNKLKIEENNTPSHI